MSHVLMHQRTNFSHKSKFQRLWLIAVIYIMFNMSFKYELSYIFKKILYIMENIQIVESTKIHIFTYNRNNE